VLYATIKDKMNKTKNVKLAIRMYLKYSLSNKIMGRPVKMTVNETHVFLLNNLDIE